MRTLQNELRRLKLVSEKESKREKQKQQQKQNLTKSELEEIMGMRKARYKRGKGGAYRSY